MTTTLSPQVVTPKLASDQQAIDAIRKAFHDGNVDPGTITVKRGEIHPMGSAREDSAAYQWYFTATAIGYQRPMLCHIGPDGSVWGTCHTAYNTLDEISF